MDINNEQFVTFLRSALHHLYDPDQLRRSPLTGLFDVSNRVDASFSLQKILIDAIEGICPDEDEPMQSRGWLIHDVLFFRYVRGYERQAVANQLGISDRQLSREQRAALETLAQYLWKAYALEGKTVNLGAGSLANNIPAESTEEASQPALKSDPSSGAAWIKDLPADKPSVWKLTVLSVLELLRPLISQNGVAMVYEPDEDLADLLVPENALRHSLLNILGTLIPLAPGGKLTLIPGVRERGINITILEQTADNCHPIAGALLPAQSGFAVAQQLVERAGGVVQLSGDMGRIEVTITIPATAQIPVLVIDDNTDTIHLFQRYTQGTRYSVVGAPGSAEFFQLLEKIHPRIVLMDVMMPDIDGWDLLAQLRQERQIPNIAVIICSILPQETLARALGADGFLQKPVLPQDFIDMLDEQMRHLADEPKIGP